MEIPGNGSIFAGDITITRKLNEKPDTDGADFYATRGEAQDVYPNATLGFWLSFVLVTINNKRVLYHPDSIIKIEVIPK